MVFQPNSCPSFSTGIISCLYSQCLWACFEQGQSSWNKGIRGLGELKRRVDSGEMKMALALYPVSMKQLMDIADTGNIMPPKTTWFEPKLRSGLVIHSLD